MRTSKRLLPIALAVSVLLAQTAFANNQKVSVLKVVTSQYFQTCLKNNTAEK